MNTDYAFKICKIKLRFCLSLFDVIQQFVGQSRYFPVELQCAINAWIIWANYLSYLSTIDPTQLKTVEKGKSLVHFIPSSDLLFICDLLSWNRNANKLKRGTVPFEMKNEKKKMVCIAKLSRQNSCDNEIKYVCHVLQSICLCVFFSAFPLRFDSRSWNGYSVARSYISLPF